MHKFRCKNCASWPGRAASPVWRWRRRRLQAPNIVMIMVDDVAPMDISAIHRGVGAVATPNIDRIATEGLMVSDFYAQPSCTAGRAAFLTGQYPIRTGLTSVGQPGSPIGLSAEDVTLATLAQGTGLHHRPVRQEPCRRPQ